MAAEESSAEYHHAPPRKPCGTSVYPEPLTDSFPRVDLSHIPSILNEDTRILVQDNSDFKPLARHNRAHSFSMPYDLETVNHSAVELFKKLSTHVVALYHERKQTLRNGQLFICVAGGPGSGKSTLSEEVAKRVNARIEETVCVLPMDGFHFSQAQLKELADSPHCIYTFEELMARRGAPWTFDVESCVKAFHLARETGEGVFPTYSRDIEDPVPGGSVLKKSHAIVFLEGNYLLAWDDPNWARLKGVFDETWYVSCTTLEQQRDRLIERHLKTWTEDMMIRWGEGRQGAAKKADSNDVLNAAWIDETSRKHADLLIEST